MPKDIEGSVGFAGRNVARNVATVQYLLNCVPVARGGPAPELAVDGIAGPKTIAAIRRFQTTNFGRADGRVDPRGRTIGALQSYDPYPDQPLGPAVHSVGKAPGTPGSPWGKQPSPPGSPLGKEPLQPPWGKQPSRPPWGKQPPGKGGSGGKSGW